MLRKVLASALAVLLILGLPLPLRAVPEEPKLVKANLETSVIVQLEKSPVLTYETRLKEVGIYTVQGAETYANTLAKDLNTVLNTAKNRGINLKTEAKYTHSFFGFSASLPFSQVAELEKVPGVKKVFPDVPVYLPKIDYTVPQTGAPALWNMPGGYTGEGMIVAVIDTGVDVDHPFLTRWVEDPGDPEEEIPVPAVIGQANFTADGALNDVTDVHGHGTHVAGIIAADGRFYGSPWEDLVGMAPAAELYAIKVLGNDGKGKSSWVMSGIEWAVNPSGDLCRADVINMSLGAAVSDPNYPTCLASNAAADAGVIVVAAAGNDGHETATVGAPSVGAKVISVASYGYQQRAYIEIEGNQITEVATCNSPLPDGLLHEVVYAGLGRTQDFTDLDVAGKIALIQRGEIAFADKGANAAAAGAVAIIVYNNTTGMIAMAGDFTIPALSTTQAIGEYIWSRMTAVPGLQIAMGADPPRDLIASSSSGGPAEDYSLKPDITAPGASVLSLVPISQGLTATMGGTSMACPHVAGGVALLKQKYGDLLSVAEYKSLLMNTADLLYDHNNEKYPVTIIGAGTMNLESAALSRGLTDKASLSLRKDGAAHMIYVRNLSDEEITYNITFISDTLTAFFPNPLTVPANNSYGFSFDVDNLASLAEGPHEGYIILTPTTEAAPGHLDILSIPVYHYVGDLDSFFLKDFSVSEEVVYPYQDFNITFTLTREVNYVQMAVFDSADVFQGGWVITIEALPAGTWTIGPFDLVGLPADTYTLELYAEVTAGDYNWRLADIDVVKMEITAPDDGDCIDAESVTVSGLAPLPCNIEVYSKPGFHHMETVASGAFSFGVDLEEGNNPITILVVADGKILDYDSVEIIRDTIAPVVEIDSPTDGSVTTRSSVLVRGRVIDANLATVLINGQAVSATTAGEFSSSVSLVVGENVITVGAEDLAGHVVSESVTITRSALPPPPVIVEDKPATERLSGSNRYATAVAVSQEGWETTEYVILARGDNYADALAGAPLAYALNAPILLTESSGLTAVTQAEIQRLRATQVIILGGVSAISQAAEDTLKGMGLTVERITGTNRYATAALIAARVAPTGAIKAVLVSGEDFPDALSVAAYAAREFLPILLTQADSLPAATTQALQNLGVKETILVGGTGVISNTVLAAAPGANRISGSNRYATSIAVAEYFKPGSTRAFIATGLNFADALSGAVLAAKNGSGILLVGNSVPQGLAQYFADKGITGIVILGGPAGVGTQLETDLKALLK